MFQLQDLKDVTSHTHYENYRTGKLTAMMKSGEVTISFEKKKGAKKTFVSVHLTFLVTSDKKIIFVGVNFASLETSVQKWPKWTFVG